MTTPTHGTDLPPPDRGWAALVATIRRHHLDTATEQDRSLLAAAKLSRLPGGRNNTAYACRIGEHHACVKIYRVDERNRAEREWRALTALAALHLHDTPKPYAYDADPALPVVVMELIAGDPLGESPLTDRELTALHDVLARLFEITPNDLPNTALPAVSGNASDMRERVKHAFSTLTDTNDPEPLARQALDCWKTWRSSRDDELLAGPAPPVFGRGDPNIRNCLWNGHTLRLIDLEYAGWSDRAYELADLIEHPESRTTPATTWQYLIDRFDLPLTERHRLHAARRLLALFWTSRLLPSPNAPHDPRYAAQVQRTAALIHPW